MIPKKLHYCWFGRGEKPELVKKCIETWQKKLPDYEIIEWNEDNCDLDATLFVRQAYDARNFAFVSDYFRAKALYSQGGIYLDTDVEVFQSFDRFLNDQAFAGFEEKAFVGTCVMGAEPGFPLFEDYLKHYESTPFLKEDGTKYSDTNVVLLTRLLEEAGLVRDDKEQTVAGMTVYPRTFFSPYDYINGISYITDDSYAIHHFAQLWLPKKERMKTELRRMLTKVIGGERVKKLRERLSK